MTALSEIRFMTVDEVATFLRVSKMTVYRLVHEGQIAAVRVGRSLRVYEESMARYVGEPVAEASAAEEASDG